MPGDIYNIDVTLNPANALTGLARIRTALISTTNAANALRAALLGLNAVPPVIQGITQNINQVGQQTQHVTQQTNLWAKAAAAVAKIYVAMEVGAFLKNTLDEQTAIQNKIKVQSRNLQEQKALYSEIVKIANRIGVSTKDYTNTYSRFATVLRPMGVSQREILEMTETLTKSFIVQGSTAQEAATGVTQLSQAFSKGILDGEELKAILEGNALLTKALSKAMDAPVGALKELGKKGKINIEKLKEALEFLKKKVETAWEKMIFTIGQSWNVVKNEFDKLLGELDRSIGITKKVSAALKWVAKNMEDILRVAGALAGIIGVRLADGALSFAIAQFTSLSSVLRLVKFSLLGATAGLIAFSDEIQYTEGSAATLEDAFASVPDALGEAFKEVGKELQKSTNDATKELGFLLEDFTVDWERAIFYVGTILEALVASFVHSIGIGIDAVKLVATAAEEAHQDAVDDASNLMATTGNLWENVKRGVNDYFDLEGPKTPVDLDRNKVGVTDDPYVKTKESLAELLESAKSFKDHMKEIQSGEGITGEFVSLLKQKAEERAAKRLADAEKNKKDLEEGNKLLDDEGGGGGGDRYKPIDKDALRRAKNYAKLLANLKVEGQLLAMTNEEREIKGKLLEINARFEGKLTETQLENLKINLEKNKNLREQRQLYEDMRSPTEQMKKDLETLKKLHDSEIESLKISNEEYRKRKAILEKQIEDTENSERLKELLANNDVGSGIEAGLMKVAAKAKTTSELIADSIESAFDKATDALATFVETGKLDFAELTRSILADISKMALKSATANLAKGLMGAGGGMGGLAGLFAGGFATGGSFTVGGTGGTDSQMVSMRATPGERVTVQTPGQQNMMAPPAPPPQDITIVNVPDKTAMGQYLGTSEGRKVLFNVVESNKTQFKRMLEN